MESQADSDRVAELGRRLGVPIYVLALDSQGAAAQVTSRGVSRRITDPGAEIQALRLVTDPTGGRLFRVGTMEQVIAAFRLVNAELRNQYVLTYYTDAPPEPGQPPRVELQVPGHKGLKAKVVFGSDQVY